MDVMLFKYIEALAGVLVLIFVLEFLILVFMSPTLVNVTSNFSELFHDLMVVQYASIHQWLWLYEFKFLFLITVCIVKFLLTCYPGQRPVERSGGIFVDGKPGQAVKIPVVICSFSSEQCSSDFSAIVICI